MILLWTDGTQEPDGLADVAAEVIVTSWNPADDDGGRTSLLTSVRDARELLIRRGEDPDGLTLVGLGRGAVAAAGLCRYAKRLGVGLGRIIAVAGMWDEPDPFSGSPIAEVPERVELVNSSLELNYLLGARGDALARLLRATEG